MKTLMAGVISCLDILRRLRIEAEEFFDNFGNWLSMDAVAVVENIAHFAWMTWRSVELREYRLG